MDANLEMNTLFWNLLKVWELRSLHFVHFFTPYLFSRVIPDASLGAAGMWLRA